MHTSSQVEDKIIYLAPRNISYVNIVQRLKNEDGVVITRQTVSRIAKRFIMEDYNIFLKVRLFLLKKILTSLIFKWKKMIE